jgi:hypothetical protein
MQSQPPPKEAEKKKKEAFRGTLYGDEPFKNVHGVTIKYSAIEHTCGKCFMWDAIAHGFLLCMPDIHATNFWQVCGGWFWYALLLPVTIFFSMVS